MSSDNSASHIADYAEPIYTLFISTGIYEFESPDVLEMGTRQNHPPLVTHHKRWIPNAGSYTMTDVADGPHVDVTADAHNMVDVFGERSMDIIIACSVWEHLKFPWVCAAEVAAVLRPGGIIYVQTHHAFPVHGYPDDYGRWTDHGLDALFEWGGLKKINSGYAYRATLTPPPEVNRWNTAAEVWLNVEGLYRKPL